MAVTKSPRLRHRRGLSHGHGSGSSAAQFTWTATASGAGPHETVSVSCAGSAVASRFAHSSMPARLASKSCRISTRTAGIPRKAVRLTLSRVLAKVRPTREHAGCNRRAATDIQLRENPPDMLAYGVAADAELPCDLLVDFSVTDQQGYLQLTPGQYLGGRERKIGGGARHADGVIDQVLRAGADDASYWPALICMIVWITAIVRVTDGDQRMAVHDKARSIRFRVALFS